MLHKFLEPGDWFAPKRLGYGAGLPIAWQGWALVGTYIAFMAGWSGFITRGDWTGWAIWAVGVIAATAILLVVAKKRTRGGWRYRDGSDRS